MKLTLSEEIEQAMSDAPTHYDDTVPAWAVRLEAKVDVALAHHGARIDGQEAKTNDHEARMRVLETHVHTEIHDHETRVRGLEKFKWTLLGAAIAAGGASGAVASSLIGG